MTLPVVGFYTSILLKSGTINFSCSPFLSLHKTVQVHDLIIGLVHFDHLLLPYNVNIITPPKGKHVIFS